jgi:hypothetical protein
MDPGKSGRLVFGLGRFGDRIAQPSLEIPSNPKNDNAGWKEYKQGPAKSASETSRVNQGTPMNRHMVKIEKT